MKTSRNIFALLVMLTLLVSSCTTWRKFNDTEKGAVIGAGTGAIVGGVVSPGGGGALVGGALGAAGGGLIGHERDDQKRRRR
jgi:uncharacterized protein YcfJ